MNISKDEVISAFSELVTQHTEGTHDKKTCVFCKLKASLFSEKNNELNKTVWAPLLQQCVPYPIALVWGETDPHGFTNLCLLLLLTGLKIGRRQMFAELMEETFNVS